MIHPAVGIALVAGVLGMLMAIAWLLGAYRAWGPEEKRKFVHVGMGLVTLSFPWLFQSPAPVLILGLGASAVLLMVRSVGVLRQTVGGVFHEVERESWGEVVYPLGVALTFWLAQGNPVFFIAPMLILTLADAVAAMIGITYGQQRYKGTDGVKSWEGSISFFVVAFFSVHVPLLLWTQTGRAETLLIALILGLILMLVEAVSWRGLDNLFLPLMTVALLRRSETLAVDPLVLRLIVLAGLFVFLWFWRSRSRLDDAALIGAGLFGYAVWMLGEPLWLLPCVGLFGLHMLKRRHDSDLERLSFGVLVAVTSPGIFWLMLPLAVDFPLPLAALGFGMVFVCHAVFVAVSRLVIEQSRLGRYLLTGSWILLGWGLLWLPFVGLLNHTGRLMMMDLRHVIVQGLLALMMGTIFFIAGAWGARSIIRNDRLHWWGALAAMTSSCLWLLWVVK